MVKDIGTRISGLREAKKITRYRLAVSSGVSYSYLVALEENKHSPSLEMIEKIASGLGTTVSKLLEESEVVK
ncbi:helix-turn-helix domain-containing protein [Paenibacillus sp. GCM10012303]|uniref:helix-turn-helix domain-containing protein n=1 Tax=Paenibacillus sp. GCM10012303 TaxID=3317340 RepID=UPI00361E82DE